MDVGFKNASRENPLHMLINSSSIDENYDKEIQLADIIIDHGISVNEADSSWSPFIYSVFTKNFKFV